MQSFSPMLIACLRKDNCENESQYNKGVGQQYVLWILFLTNTNRMVIDVVWISHFLSLKLPTFYCISSL